MTTYCRITGKSRGLPKPNYFPLLPPISPADAKRFCRITGKAYGLPTHHYIPVLVSKQRKPKKRSSENSHVILAGYRYLFPCLEEAPQILEILNGKSENSCAKYVYTVSEKKCGLIFCAKLEAAVRDGDVVDVMLAKDTDTVLLQLKEGEDISVAVKEIHVDEIGGLLAGEGTPSVCRRQKLYTDVVKKYFSDNGEKTQESQSKGKVKTKNVRDWKNVKPYNIIAKQPSFNVWEWGNFEEIGGISSPAPTPKPVLLKPSIANLSKKQPDIFQQPYLSANYINLPIIQVVAPFKHLSVEMEPSLLQSIISMSDDSMKNTSSVNLVMADKLDLIPNMSQISDVINVINSGVSKVIQKDGLNLSGMEIEIDNSKKFIVGQFVKNSAGEAIFIAGQTIETCTGKVFVPGIITNNDNELKLLPGFVFKVDAQSEFVAGQITLTSSGEKFVPGQAIKSQDGIKFQPGQTVFSNGLMKFLPGQIYEERFIPGQIVTTETGAHFIAGQTINSPDENIFIPGQSMWSEKGWEFVPGMTVNEDSQIKFIPGRHVNLDPNSNTTTFVPGQYVKHNKATTFVPGITDDSSEKFISGLTINTPEGLKFIRGQVTKTSDGDTFVPGFTKIVNGEAQFLAATRTEELAFIESQHSLDQSLFLTEISPKGPYADGVFGHMVQSIHGVQFFPGPNISNLPAGKVVPGKLIRGDQINFVPGIMVNGTFVPGQVAISNNGEHFIPGQVIETSHGLKFVPGKIIQTKLGDKFVPGQTIVTEDGPKFIPGQIIDTKSGPTFIPGQIIRTDEDGCKFVPGQVVDTNEGPHFVPGRVIETGENIIFIPGQVVETSEGLRFVAPDLAVGNGDNGFTVQGFKISQEELRLLQPISGETNTIEEREMVIDSKMLRQLSEAGMTIGRQVSAEIPVVSISRSVPAMSAACELATKLKLDSVTTVKLGELIAAIVQMGKLGEISDNSEEILTLNKILKRIIKCKTEEEACKLVSNIFENEMLNNISGNVDKMHDCIIVSSDSPLRKLNKITLMKEILNSKINSNQLIQKLAVVMNEEDESVSCALQCFSEVQPEILHSIVERFSDTIGDVSSEKDMVETLHRAIVATVRESSEMSIIDLFKTTENLDLKRLILEAVSLAKALDMTETATSLLDIMSNPKCTNILAGDRITLEILRRITVMRALAMKRPELLEALKNLYNDPYGARTDPGLKQLVKESAALLVIPEEVVDEAEDIPQSLLLSRNSLAMEDLLYRTKRKYNILVILKKGIQAIIPNEAAHLVLTGSVPYASLDDNGLRYFEPKHVFTALKLPKIAMKWFSLYKQEYKYLEYEI